MEAVEYVPKPSVMDSEAGHVGHILNDTQQ